MKCLATAPLHGDLLSILDWSVANIMLHFVSTVVATEVRGLMAVCRVYWVLGAAVMS